jgi:hypothetical protein
MVSKCANPACSTPFHYLREGKIFRVEVEVTPAVEETTDLSDAGKIPFLVAPRKPNRKLEHFWLCGPCSQKMSLMFDKDSGVSVIPKPQTRATAAAAS